MPYKSFRDQVDRRIEAALIRASNKANGKAVALAKPRTPVRTGTAQGSITFKPAEAQGSKIVSEFGSYNVDYFIWLEIGTRRRAALHILATSANEAYADLEATIREELKAAGL